MAWSKYLELNLSVNGLNAIGSPQFNGFGESYKFPAGQYRLSYVSGGVISYSSEIINPKYNRYEIISGGLYFGQYSPSYFPEQKRYVWQCMYGTLPGFTSGGFNNPNLIKNLFSDTYLDFSLNRTTTLNFWYTDDCPACTNGNIQYDVYRYEETDSYTNGITVLTMNIENPFEHETTEFYHHRTPPPPRADSTIPFTASVWLSHLRNISVNHVEDIKGFNSLGLKENATDIINLNPSEYNNMDSYPVDTLDHRYSQYSYWKIVKNNSSNTLYDLISEFTLDPNSHNQGTSTYESAKKDVDRYPMWYYDLLPGNYSIVYLSGATSIYQVSNHTDYGYTSYSLNGLSYDFKETTPPLSEQWINTFCCNYGTLPGIIYTDSAGIISGDFLNAETATAAIQNKILNDEISGVLNFSIINPERLYIWFNDFDTPNSGTITFRLYKGTIRSNEILKDFIEKQENGIQSLSENSLSERKILNTSETHNYLKSIFNKNVENNFEKNVIDLDAIYQYYINKINDMISIIKIKNDELLTITDHIIGGPFFDINEAKQFIFNFCNINDLDYEEIPGLKTYTVAIGEK